MGIGFALRFGISQSWVGFLALSAYGAASVVDQIGD